ncbi:unnamed protein product [Ixodes persulcatus]
MSSPHLTPIPAPSASNCSEIWKASSRVGVSTRANRRCGVSRRACRMGRAKEPVFPDPVSASPMTSLPVVEKGPHSFWIFVGDFHLSCSQASQRTSTMPCNTDLKVTSSSWSSTSTIFASSDFSGSVGAAMFV